MRNKRSNPDLTEVFSASYGTIRQWHQHVNPTLSWRLHSRGFNKKYVKAEDIYYFDDEGKKYLDFLGGFGLNIIGHNHPRIKKVVNDFLKESVPVFMQAGHLPAPGALAEKITEITGLNNCFFGNSGTEVVEGAIKLARKSSGKKRIIYAQGAFHGKSLGSLSITGRRSYQEPFEPLLPGCHAVPYGDSEAIENELKKGDVALVVLEPIQGEGGIILPPPRYLKEVERLCRKYKALLFLDEIQTGLGRTGKMFAYQHEEVTPDILTLAKGLSGTLSPIGALISKGDVWKKAYGSRKNFTLHTSTFGGNNLSCLVGLTTLKIIEDENLIENAKKQGFYLLEGLAELFKRYPDVIKETRGKGLLAGIEFREPKGLTTKFGSQATQALFDENYTTMVATALLNKYQIVTAYTLNNNNVLRIEPPLTVKKEHIDRFLTALDEILNSNFWKLALKGSGIMVRSVLKGAGL